MAPLASWLKVAALAGELSGRHWPRRLVRAVMADPRIIEVSAGGVPATLALPGGRLPCPAFVFVNGVTALGRRHPVVQRFTEAAARNGFVCLVPDTPGLSNGELTNATVDGVVSAARWLTELPEAQGSKVGLTGVSLGTTLSLLAAGRHELAQHVSAVGGLAGLTSLPNAIRAATTGQFADHGRPFAYRSSSFLTLVVGRSVIANLESTEDRARLRPLLLNVADNDPDPLAPLREIDSNTMSAGSRAALNLLINRDPVRFAQLYAALPDTLSATMRLLSPIDHADRLASIPIELASAPQDTYFPLSESQALVDLLPTCRLTVSRALGHAIPNLNAEGAREAYAFAAFLARVLSRISEGTG